MQLIFGVTLPEALPNSHINTYYIKNLTLVKANNGSFTKKKVIFLLSLLDNENVLCT